MGERFLIDSNIILYSTGNIEITEKIKKHLTSIFEVEINISVISKIELLGFPGITSQEEEKINSVLKGAIIYHLTDEIIERTIQIRRNKVVKVPDAIIAATAIENNFILVTRNTADFRNIKYFKLSNPFVV